MVIIEWLSAAMILQLAAHKVYLLIMFN